MNYQERQRRLESARVTNSCTIDSLTAKLPVRKERKAQEAHRPDSVVSRYHVDRCYKSPVDGTWHLEDSDSERVQNAKHPQEPGSYTNFNCHITEVEHITGSGTVRRSYAPSAPVADREAWHARNREIHETQHNARLIANGERRIKTVSMYRLSPTLVAVGCDLVDWDGTWVPFQCDGFSTM